MQEEDEDIFRAEMGDIQPLKTTPKVTLRGKREDDPGMAQRRADAVQLANDTGAPFSLSVAAVEPLAVLSFKRSGVQTGVFRKLRLGHYQIEARLDLHRLTVEQALAQIHTFIRDSLEHDIRCVLITHGKGLDRKEPAKLKSCVAAWLPQFDEVLALHSAQKQHGGAGATYVLLKKSPKKRQENWERHIGRRG